MSTETDVATEEKSSVDIQELKPQTEREVALKIDKTDPSLLIDAPRINKKLVKAGIAAVGGILVVGMMFTTMEPQQESSDDVLARALGYRFGPGDELDLSDEAIRRLDMRPEPVEETQEEELLTRLTEADREEPARFFQEDQRQFVNEPPVAPRSSAPPPPPPQTQAPAQQPLAPHTPAPVAPPQQPVEDPEDSARRASIFHENVTPSQNGQSQAALTSEDELRLASAEEARARAAAAGRNEFMMANQQHLNEEFLASAQRGRGGYLESTFTSPINPRNEIRAGTIIPITLITGINSDLPGDISAQVIEDVYDSQWGNQVLIPRGSRVVGRYDSSVAFGQDRVLISWDRLIRPDGITILLRGMQGTDIAGSSGMADSVDRHIDELLLAVGIESAYNVSQNALIALLSEIPGFSALGSFFEGDNTMESASEIVEAYVQRTLNRQPTISIRAGMRGNIFVNKDIVLPEYDVSSRGGF